MLVDIMELNISQNYQTGEIVREWVVAETIQCFAKAIIVPDASNTDTGKVFTKTFKQKQSIKLKSTYKISSRKKITNVRNAADQVVLFSEDKIDDSPTIYDVEASFPVFDPFGNIVYYETLLYRSDVQDGN